MENQVALDMREIADKVNEERQQKIIAIAEQWVDEIAYPIIKQTAERGEYHLDIQIPNDIHKWYVAKRLQEYGFTTEYFGKEYGRYLRVKW